MGSSLSVHCDDSKGNRYHRDGNLRLATVKAKGPFDPTRVGSLFPGGVVLCLTRLTDLSYELHGGRMACDDSNVDIWKQERL